MYLRWKVRGVGPATVTRSAQLVKSERVDGKPRQRIVAYLGALQDGARDVRAREWFWKRLLPRLDALNLDAAERARIVAQIAEVVPRGTEVERLEEARSLAERQAAWQREWAAFQRQNGRL